MKNFVIYHRTAKGVVVRSVLQAESFLEATTRADRLLFFGEVIILIRDASFDNQHLDIQSGQ